MMTITKWHPYRGVARFGNDLESFFKNYEVNNCCHMTAAEVRESDNEYRIDMELPGMEKDDISITFKEGVLEINGEKKPLPGDENEIIHGSERYYGQIKKSFSLPEGINSDDIKASFTNGVLRLSIPKAEEVKPKIIAIEG